MRRLIALLVMLAFLTSTAGPAIAACRMRTAQKQCCCDAAPENAICPLDCCGGIRAVKPVASLSARSLLVFTVPTALSLSRIAIRPPSSPISGLAIGLHERAAPRLPLRV
jgi:hypothetical protein